MPIDPAKPFDLTFTVDPSWDGLRLDHFVKAMIPAMSRTKIQRYIKAGRVEVNQTSRSANWRVRTADTVLLRCNVPEEGADAGKRIPLAILYEDADIVVVNKQPGLVVHPVSLHRHDTLLNALYWRYKDELPEDQELSLANRLDEQTSGVILATKHAQAKRVLQEQFEARTPQKAYLALCVGLVEADAAEIDLPLGPAVDKGDRCQIVVRTDGAGKPSSTRFAVLERFDAPAAVGAPGEPAPPGYTLVHLEPKTGRQHQLRVHMAAQGHALVCDPRYGRPEPVAAISPAGARAVLGRTALHAAELSFRHPRTHEPMSVRAPLPADLQGLLDGLRRGWRVEVEAAEPSDT